VRRYLIIPAALLALLAGAAPASAATTAKAPRPYCAPVEWWDPVSSCFCPDGWHVVWPPAWEVWRSVYCARGNPKYEYNDQDTE
jgi:hypothetical protein